MVKRSSRTVLLFLVVGILAFLVCSGSARAQAAYPDKKNECRQCHARRVNDIAVAGGGHKGVPCSGCHAGHPPEVKKPITPCNTCHLKRKKDHFGTEMQTCLNCHTNPHKPLDISLRGAGNDACLTCHFGESMVLRRSESKHTTLDCSTCHDVHRKIPQCTQCHKPHSGMIIGDCKLCHSHGHMPKVQALPEAYPSKDCGSCHKTVADRLSATASKHKTLTCLSCHELKHGFKPACQDCHGTHHPEGMLIKFPQCIMCHYSPHDLNNWPETATREAKGEARKKQ